MIQVSPDAFEGGSDAAEFRELIAKMAAQRGTTEEEVIRSFFKVDTDEPPPRSDVMTLTIDEATLREMVTGKPRNPGS